MAQRELELLEQEAYNSLDERIKRVEKVIEDIFRGLNDLTYIHVYDTENSKTYEISYSDLTLNSFRSVVNDYKGYLVNINKTITDIWHRQDIDKTINITLVDTNNRESVLMMSEDSIITFTAYDYQTKEGTEQDWIDYFIYIYKREPKNKKELNQFKIEKSKVIFE